MITEDDLPESDDRLRELARAIEALVFAADEPVEARQIASVVSEVSQGPPPTEEAIREAVDFINAACEQQERPLRIRQWAGGFRMTTTEDVAAYLKVYFRSDRRQKLTRSLMETLAILCYKQPATKPEIDYVRGVDSDYALRRLLDMGLIAVLERSDAVGRPLLYGTTPRFLEEFGLSGLDQLPNLREIEELLGDPSFSQTRASLLMMQGIQQQEPPEPRDSQEES